MVSESNAFVKKLAHNDASVRESSFQALCAFLSSKTLSKLDHLEMKKIWKGLYFSMWFCDKPIPQQNLAGNLGKLFSEVIPSDSLQTFHQAFWAVLLKEWHSIDKWRLDKYLMLVRRVLRHLLFRLAAEDWPQAKIDEFLLVLKEYPLCNDSRFPQSLAYHVCDIFLDEIEYVVFKDFRLYSEELDDDDDDDDDEDDDDDLDDEEDDEEDDADDDEGEGEEDGNQDEDKLANQDDAAKEDLKKLTGEELAAKKRAVADATPIASLLIPFQELSKNAKNKALRMKIKEEILDDDRLKEWGLVKDTDNVNSDEEWTGF